MIQTTAKTMKTRKHRNITIISLLCAFAMGLSIWFFTRDNNPFEEPENTETTISAGDTVVVNVFADEMSDVYGYQFDINYDRDYLEYTKRLYSDIDEILTIFATDKEWCLLVGATMIGNSIGYNGQDVPVCRVEFTALTDFNLKTDSTSEHLTISSVNVATGDSQYLENIDGWTVSLKPQ